MSLVGFKARNHPQQVGSQGAKLHVDDMATPPELFDPLNARFGFELDVAASERNAKCARYYTLEDDGLTKDWTDERVWCNPPYSNIEPWVEKMWSAVPEIAVMLVPANRTEQGWWQRWVEPYRDASSVMTTQFLPGRPRFIRYEDGIVRPNERPPFGCCLLIWKRGLSVSRTRKGKQ